MKSILALFVLLISMSALAAGQPAQEKAAPPRRGDAPPPRGAAAGTARFVNQREGLNDELSAKFVAFSFDYPASWTLEADGAKAGEKAFIQLHRSVPDSPAYLEYVSFSPFSASCPMLEYSEVRKDFSELANSLIKVFTPAFDEMRVVSEGRTKIGRYEAYELRFESRKDYEAGGRVSFWGRLVFVPGVYGRGRGVSILMFASSRAPEVRGLSQVGVAGQLPLILDSFSFAPADAGNRREPAFPRMTRMVMGSEYREVNGQNEIVDPSSEFATTSQIASVWQADGVRGGTVYRQVWSAEDAAGGAPPGRILHEKKEVIEEDVPCGTTLTVSHREKREAGWPPGKYRFEVFLDGELMKSFPFVIK
jgi:hypothetical protein